MIFGVVFFFFKQKTACDIPKRDWSSDVCSSDLVDGQIYVTTPAPAGQVLYPKVLDVYNTGPTGNAVTDILYGPYPMNTTGGISLYDRGGVGTYNIVGNTVTRRVTVGNAWDHNVYSREGYAGTAYVSGVLDTVNTFLALTDNITDGNYGIFRTSVHRSGDGHWYAYEAGSPIDLGTGFTAQTRWTITYDGASARYYGDGVLVRGPVSMPNNMVMYAGACSYAAGNTVSGIDFGPFSDRLWANLASRPSNLSALT